MANEHIPAILLILLSLAMMRYPAQIWRISEAWKIKKSKTATCSKAYIILLRCVGALFLIAGFIIVFILR